MEAVSRGLEDSDAGRVLEDEALGCQLDERCGALEP